ncbi:MAG: 16S rRNA (uracil(1498)-N(3))-methyltransferase [Clostridia bacterium]|nr:16S rRNA (uracil(1498)-N(3))-methyltransferase [Clostridia bacterium]
MPRFFMDINALVGDTVTIDGENGRHLSKSLRVRPGEEVTLCDNRGKDYQAEVTEVVGDEVYAEVKSIQDSVTEPSVSVTLYQCITKSDKFELVTQKAVELGTDAIVPVSSEFCVAKIDGKEEKKIARWQKIAFEAAKQCGRGKIPEVRPSMSFKEAVKEAEGLKIMCYEHGGKPFRDIIADMGEEKNIAIFIGSEGGFSEKEVELAKENGVNIATLGKRILRTETAPICAISVIMALTGNLE